jgi:hypothetical protein
VALFENTPPRVAENGVAAAGSVAELLNCVFASLFLPPPPPGTFAIPHEGFSLEGACTMLTGAVDPFFGVELGIWGAVFIATTKVAP